MSTSEQISQLIENATKRAEGLRSLGRLIEIDPSSLIEMKKGKRPANWRVRGKLRAVLGEDPTYAFMAAIAEDLEESKREDEKKAAEGFKYLLATDIDNWRKR